MGLIINLEKEVRLYMVFDLLGDIERTGPLLWKINRKRLEDVKNHVMDLIFIVRILSRHLPSFLDFDLIYDYVIFHDLPESITGDITKFEGVPESEVEYVTEAAVEYLSLAFNDVIDIKKLFIGYKTLIDIESKIVHMIDKIQSAITFLKYESEARIDMDNPDIIPSLRNHPFVTKKIIEGKELSDIFYEYHSEALSISDVDCEKYRISRADADSIVDTIKAFIDEIYRQKQEKVLLVDLIGFPKKATKYNQRFK